MTAHIREALALLDPTQLPGRLVNRESAVVCEGAKFHSPTPLSVRSYSMHSAVAEAVFHSSQRRQDDQVWLCSTCWDNLRILLILTESASGGLSWEVRREFGNLIRALADRAWAHYVDPINEPVRAKLASLPGPVGA